MRSRERLSTNGKGLVWVDYERLKLAIVNLGKSETDFANYVGISTHTMDRIRHGAGVRPSILKVVADFLKLAPADLLAERHSRPGSSPHGDRFWPRLEEWQALEEIGGWLQAASGLRYRIYRLQHRQLPERFARGKCYELGRLATAEDQRIRALLLRHPRVCQRFRGHPQIPVNLAVFAESSGSTWWVIDEWLPGHTLAAALQIGPLPHASLPMVMKKIAEGLLALHGVGIIRRELAPWNVLLRQEGGMPVLTDFEQSKLLDGSPTVSPLWSDDPYRAPEVTTSTQLDGRADLYSWGRIFVHAAVGRIPEMGKEKELVDRMKLPLAVRNTVLRCVAVPLEGRPESVEAVLGTIRDWQ